MKSNNMQKMFIFLIVLAILGGVGYCTATFFDRTKSASAEKDDESLRDSEKIDCKDVISSTMESTIDGVVTEDPMEELQKPKQLLQYPVQQIRSQQPGNQQLPQRKPIMPWELIKTPASSQRNPPHHHRSPYREKEPQNEDDESLSEESEDEEEDEIFNKRQSKRSRRKKRRRRKKVNTFLL